MKSIFAFVFAIIAIMGYTESAHCVSAAITCEVCTQELVFIKETCVINKRCTYDEIRTQMDMYVSMQAGEYASIARDMTEAYGDQWISLMIYQNYGERETCIATKLCGESCSGCVNCTTTDWANGNTGYQTRTVATCNCETCTKKKEYRCAPGYWGTSSNGTSGCTRCPQSGSSAAGTTSQTGCYVTGGNDAGGTFNYASDCHYK